MNPIVKKITAENIAIEKDYNNLNTFTYHSGRNLITYPAFQNLNDPAAMFSLAHELGHHMQYLSHFSRMARTDKFCYLLMFPLVLWEEVDAWFKAYKICKSEGIQLEGFLGIALKAINSYVLEFLYNIFYVLKNLVGIYISSVFIIRFFMISEQMQLKQPEFMLEFRSAIINSTDSYNELVSNTFSSMLPLWIIGVIMVTAMKFINGVHKK